MKKFISIVRSIEGLLLIICSGLVVRDNTIASHFNSSGKFDAYGSGIEIIIAPIVVIWIGEVMIAIDKASRKKAGTVDSPFIYVNEWQQIVALTVISVVLLILMILKIVF